MTQGTEDTLFASGGSRLSLQRPHRGGRSLRAWDAADEQLVAEARERLEAGQRVAVVDDSFGALALGLQGINPVVIADSAALPLALSSNAPANQLPEPEVMSWGHPLIRDSGQPFAAERFDAVILKVPRQLDYLEFLLRWANQVLQPGGWLLTGGMIKHLPDQAARLYQQLVTTEAVMPARRKARLVLCRPGSGTLDDWPGLWEGYAVGGVPAEVQGLPAVFAREKLDIGTRELLPLITSSVSSLPEQARVLDLACGNGVLGLSALVERPDLAVTFTDISSQALLSARNNVDALGIEAGSCRYLHADGISEEAGRFDRILLNPPFHEGGVVGDHIALRLFRQAAAVLSVTGELLMVGNRHLGYHKSLRAVFDDVEQLRATPKFVVFRAARPRQRSGRS